MDNGIILLRIVVKSRRNKTLHVGCHAAMDDGSEWIMIKKYNIRESEFIILPKKVIILIQPVGAISKTINSFFCYKNYMEIGELSVIKIELFSGIELSNLNNPSSFTTNESLVIYYNPSDYDQGVMILICKYNAIDQPFVLLRKKFKPEDVVLVNSTISGNLTRRSNNTINGNSNGTTKSGSNATLNSAINKTVSLIVITVIIAVTIIISLKLKNKKKNKKNDDIFISIDISNRNSGSSLSSASKSTSQSISNFLKLKNSRSKFKVPIMLGSLSDPSMSINTSKLKSLSRRARSKVVSNERRASKTK
uniref:Ephrin RBD domain-containing protein n=1 Tax=Strongyloides venezuelensis TaxID=75913 RepID=A0A0K0G3L4_STRVS